MWEESFKTTTVRPVMCRSTRRKGSRPVQSTLWVLISWWIAYWNHFCSVKTGSKLQFSMVQSNFEPEFNAKGHPRTDVFLVIVRFTHPPEVPPGKGFVESSRPSSSVQGLELLGYSLCCYCFICLYLLLLVLWIKGTVLDMLGKCLKTEYTPTPLLSGDSGFSFTNFHWNVSPH